MLQNGLDLSGSDGDRRGSPGRSERRFAFILRLLGVITSRPLVMSLLLLAALAARRDTR
jgi:hypothetical protein